jgi:hypothetical protein
MFTRISISVFLLCSYVVKGAENPSIQCPFVVVYSQGDQPVEDVSVAITNTRKDVALLITSVEFDKQLPELRYFYHGIYGSIVKKENNYEHNAMQQTLSRPVATCFLLPEQSISWKRPMRVLVSGYHARISWHEIPISDIAKTVWFHTKRDTNMAGIYIYEPLSKEKEKFYRNSAVANNVLPEVVIEGDFPLYSAELDVSCITRNRFSPKSDLLKNFPDGSIEYHLTPIADSVVVTGEKVTFFKFKMATKSYETISCPDLSPVEIDFMFLCYRKEKKTIPCILDPEVFSDIIEVQRPYVRMYYNPGITEVPLNLFSKILARARERKIAVLLRWIDPNSLGRQYVMVVGVEVDDKGRQKNVELQIKPVP